MGKTETVALTAFVLGLILGITGNRSTVTYVDPDTSCEYIVSHSGGIYPRLNKWGHMVCAEELK